MSNPSARIWLRSALRLTSFCDIELHPVLDRNALTWSEASALVAVAPSYGKEGVWRNGVEGQCHNLFEGNRWSGHLLRPTVDDDVDLMLLFRHPVFLLAKQLGQ
jgi:hypothetical protein